MPMDRFLIAPLNSGLQTDLRPWQIMDDSFEELQNAYVFRGRVRKRYGSTFMGTTGSQLNSRVRVQVGTIGAPASPVPGAKFNIGSMISAGTQIFTVYQAGNPAAMLATGPGTGTFSTVTGAFALAATGLAAGTPIYYYPAEPIMGITQYDSGQINNHPTYAFDTQFAYVFSGGAWARSGTALWTGDNTKYFWAANWQGSASTAASDPVMFVSNFNGSVGAARPTATDDPIWTFNGTTWTARRGSTVNGFFFLPTGGARVASPFIQTARIILPFKNRLVLLNTVENDNSGGAGTGTATSYVNRCRYSFNGSPFANNAWYEPNQVDAAGAIAAGAGFIDAATEEQIVSAEFIKDRLMVYFERSTWELVYTGNEILPFVWQKLNTELGSQATFSTVPFDKDVLTIGNTGVHACNGSNVQRIDNKIPNEIFDYFETKNNASQRTCGIRDYYNEMVYWAFAESNQTSTQTFPDQILAYNYQNKSWAIFDDTVTTFGYFEQGTDVTWATSIPATWDAFNGTWVSSLRNANQRLILMGTPEGFINVIDEDVAYNAPSMQITNIVVAATGLVTLTIINHNLVEDGPLSGTGDYIYITSVAGDATISAYFLANSIFPVDSVIDADTIIIDTNIYPTQLTSGTYTGAGTASKVSNIQIKTKQFNPYDKQDRNVYLAKVNFAVQKTILGKITVDYFPSASPVSMIQGGVASGAIMGTSVLETSPYDPTYYPLEQFQQRLWHPVYFQASGECIQLYLYFTPQQMLDSGVVFSDFEMEAMILYTQALSDRMQ